MPDQNAAIELLNRIEVVLRQLERASRNPRCTCLNCRQEVVNTGQNATCTIGQPLRDFEDWRRTLIPGGVDWT